jgi:adenosylcobinamide-phosphate synthase
MTPSAQVITALAVDMVFGDPRWFPHPVKFIGRLAVALEAPTRRVFRNPRLAGVVTVAVTVGAAALAAWGMVAGARRIHPWLADAVAVLLLYTCFAARDLAAHALDVFQALSRGDVELARSRVARMVGRDTATLDEPGIVRATVESVAENTVDGVTAPLFFAVLGGPALAMAYKAASTLDSTFGYKNERYLKFGWASARLDDAAAWLPARLTFPLVALAAALVGGRPASAWKYGRRDCRKHASPNAGLPEAAFAGALGVQLGGLLLRHGRPIEMPRLGEPREALDRRHIPRSVALMFAVSLLAAASFLGVLMCAQRIGG